MNLRRRGLALSSRALAAFAVLACLALCLQACLAPVKTRFTENEDFSRYRRWSWVPREGAPVIRSHRAGARDLDARIGEAIERILRGNGFIHVDRDGEFYVTYDVSLQRRQVVVDVPMGMQLVNSYNSSASYWVEGFDREIRIYDELELTIGIADPTGKVLWHGSLVEPIEDRDLIPARKAVDTLLKDLPVSLPDE